MFAEKSIANINTVSLCNSDESNIGINVSECVQSCYILYNLKGCTYIRGRTSKLEFLVWLLLLHRHGICHMAPIICVFFGSKSTSASVSSGMCES